MQTEETLFRKHFWTFSYLIKTKTVQGIDVFLVLFQHLFFFIIHLLGYKFLCVPSLKAVKLWWVLLTHRLQIPRRHYLFPKGTCGCRNERCIMSVNLQRREAGTIYPWGEYPAVCLMSHSQTIHFGQFRRWAWNWPLNNVNLTLRGPPEAKSL